MNRLWMGIAATCLLLAGLGLGVLAIAGLSQDSSTSIVGWFGPGSDLPPQAAAIPDAAKDSGWMTEYTLTERSGRKFRSRDLKGKVHVANFFFTTCPTVCRMQTAAVQGLAKEFGPQGVTFLSITCDPDNDDPAALMLYAQQFDADPKQWLFLTGDLLYLRRVGAEVYSLAVDHATHSELLAVVDGQGKVRGRFSWKKRESIDEMKAMLAELLASEAASGTDGTASAL